MGTGIAALARGYGVPVLLVDVTEAKLADARADVETQLRHARLLGACPADRPVGGLATSTEIEDAASATCVIEAITEDLALKAKLLAELSAVVDPGTPLISNTSGIPIGELAQYVQRPEELLGTHFMNPTYLIRMAEVVRGPQTSQRVIDDVTALLARLDRQSIVVNDSPGFVTSRLLHPMINDATRLVGAGTASAESVDDLMQGCLGHPTGPLRTADLIGLDNLADSLRVLAERTGNRNYEPSELLLTKVREGNLGRKSGKGFYEYGKVFS